MQRRALTAWPAIAASGGAFGVLAGGTLTEAFDWRAIFFAQAPVAAIALAAALAPEVRLLPVEAKRVPASRRTLAANLGLVCVFGALVGALFLAVLMIVTVWEYGPLAGAGVVSALPAAALGTRFLSRSLGGTLDIVAGAVLLALGLGALALLPSTGAVYPVLALAVCGAGFGLAVPPLTHESVPDESALAWRGTVSVAARHAGLVLALVVIAPLLAYELDRGGDRATVNATAAILDARIGLDKKIPIALDLKDEFEATPIGDIPDLVTPFEKNGAASSPDVRRARDSLLDTIRAALTRSFRSSYAVAALLALLTVAPVALVRPWERA
jgi:hypothetical protein